MAPNTKKAEHLDEIVFEYRNKAYGAYLLRKIYKKHVTIGVIIATTVLLIGVTVPLIAGYLNKQRIINEEKTVGAELTNMNKPPEDVPPPPPPPPPEELEQKVAFKAPIVVTDSVEESAIFVQDDLALQSQNTTVDTTEFVVQENTVIQEVKEEAFLVVEEMPTYPGGDDAMNAYFGNNIVYPDLERENGVQGLVVISFVVEKDGSLSNVSIYKGLTPNLDEEAIRVVRKMPKWNPGMQTGRNVRVIINLPLRFTLE